MLTADRATRTITADPLLPYGEEGRTNLGRVTASKGVVTIPPDAKSVIVSVTTFLLTMALAAVGLETDIGKLYAKGLRPLVVGATASVFISLFSLTLIKLTS